MNLTPPTVPYQTFNVMQAGARRAGAPSPAPDPTAAKRLQPLHAELLARLPKAARVLFVGDVSDAALVAYQRSHRPLSCDKAAAGTGLSEVAEGCDLLVFADGLDGIGDPGHVLQILAARCAPDAQLFICEAGSTQSIDQTFAMLADSGWMPDLLVPDAQGRELADGASVRLIQATRIFATDPAAAHGAGTARFSVIVASPISFDRPPAAVISPGLAEVRAQVVMAADPTSAAHAFAKAVKLDTTESDWILLCHQNTYFPAGFGHQLNALLAEIAKTDQEGTLIGFIGIGVDVSSQSFAPAGFVIEQLHREDHPACQTAVSIDELALVISRRSAHRIDPAMGWDLWATDLCLAAICEHQVFPRIARMPLLNRAAGGKQASTSLQASAARLLEKFPAFGPIPTLSGTIDANFVQRLPRPLDCQPTASHRQAEIARPAPRVTPEASVTARSSIEQAVPAAPECSICGAAVSRWSPHPQTAMRSEFMKLLDPVGSDLSVYQCPHCGSTDRDRHLWHYMRAIGLLQRLPSAQVLHIAPETHLEALIQALRPPAYIRGDLHPRRADHLPLNVESLPFDDGSFDLIICNHVLEHVASPAQALAEFHRCLVPGGLLIAQTPYAPVLMKTMELNRPVSPGFAKLFFGQEDHVRLFGADIVDYFHDAGFQGELLAHSMVLGDMDAKAFGCNAREPFFAFSK